MVMTQGPFDDDGCWRSVLDVICLHRWSYLMVWFLQYRLHLNLDDFSVPGRLSSEKSLNFYFDDNRAEDTRMLINQKDNVFIVSDFKSNYLVLQLDLSSVYLLAGSLTGPGAFNFVSEMVQTSSVVCLTLIETFL
ncbi:hypothetical protein V6N12_067608 [Hibiscus sabdariffa]|uniref:Uncharacterized protein n=2 Tax=Hibiscus sabdariffa TaxID=183260 RepID=A0ABR2B8D6_9ROSI